MTHWPQLEQRMPVNFDTFRRFLPCDEVMERIIRDLSMNNEEVIERISNDNELREMILKDFYIRYFTNIHFREYHNFNFNDDCPSAVKEQLMHSILELPSEYLPADWLTNTEQSQNLIENKEETAQEDDGREEKVSTAIALHELSSQEANQRSNSIVFRDECIMNIMKEQSISDVFEKRAILRLIKKSHPYYTTQGSSLKLDSAEANEIRNILLSDVEKVNYCT